jgi:hypothetical protein
VNIIN